MPSAITVRDVPDDVRGELTARAAREGKSLEQLVRELLVKSVSRSRADDVIARARARVESTGVRVNAEAILAYRDTDRRRR